MDHAPTIKDVFHVAGDAPDPDGGDLRGLGAGYDLTKGAIGHPMLLYRVGGAELLLEADVHALPGEPRYIHIVCPRCLARGRTQMLTIREDRKQLSYDRLAEVPTFPGWSREQMRHSLPNGAGGLLSVEPFGCTWEATPELARGYGLGKCGWRVAIDNNVVRDVRP